LFFVFFVFGLMVLNTTFNNISVISWRSVFLVEETGVTGENHRPVASHWQTLFRIQLPYNHDHDGPTWHYVLYY